MSFWGPIIAAGIGAAGSALGGGDNTQQTTLEAPAWILPELRNAANQATVQYSEFTPQLFPGSSVAGLSPYTDAAIGALANFNNSPHQQGVINAGQDALRNLSFFGNAAYNPTAVQGQQTMGMAQPGVSQILSRAGQREGNVFGDSMALSGS